MFVDFLASVCNQRYQGLYPISDPAGYMQDIQRCSLSLCVPETECSVDSHHSGSEHLATTWAVQKRHYIHPESPYVQQPICLRSAVRSIFSRPSPTLDLSREDVPSCEDAHNRFTGPHGVMLTRVSTQSQMQPVPEISTRARGRCQNLLHAM